MKTNPDDFSEHGLNALFAAARVDRPDTSRSEYGFETRLMAHLSSDATKPPFWWGAWSWRLVPLFAVVALALSLWTRYTPLAAAADLQTRSFLEWSVPTDDDLGGLVLDDFLSAS